MTALKTRLLGLAGCLAILFLIVGTPLILLATDAIPRPSDLTWSRLTAPDDGTLALVIISGVAWIAWVVMVMSFAAEVMARLRGRPSLRLPGLAIPQLAAGRLLAAAALLFVSAPVASSSLSTPPAAAAASLLVVPVAATSVVPSVPAPPVAEPERSSEPAPTFAYTVKRGDTLWKIAQELLGDGTRYREIVALNTSALNGQPDFINPGLVLRLPDERQADQDGQYVVQPGDTLSEIAQRELGDARRVSEDLRGIARDRPVRRTTAGGPGPHPSELEADIAASGGSEAFPWRRANEGHRSCGGHSPDHDGRTRPTRVGDRHRGISHR